VFKLKQEGVQVDTFVEVCEIAFPGDTSTRVLETEPAVGAARVLLLECTFLNGDVSAKDAQRTGHVHLDDLVGAVKAGAFKKTEVLLLTHFSARYNPIEVRDIMEKRLRDTEVWPKVQFLLPKPRV
jgi:ribonuclease BN (tRNA processing enzyme)